MKNNLIIGGLAGFVVHFMLVHQGDFATLLTVGPHIIDGIAFVLAGAFMGLIINKPGVLK